MQAMFRSLKSSVICDHKSEHLYCRALVSYSNTLRTLIIVLSHLQIFRKFSSQKDWNFCFKIENCLLLYWFIVGKCHFMHSKRLLRSNLCPKKSSILAYRIIIVYTTIKILRVMIYEKVNNVRNNTCFPGGFSKRYFLSQ